MKSKFWKRLEPQEWLAAFGALVAIVGFLVPPIGPGQLLSTVVKTAGFAVFLAGLILAMRISARGIEDLRTKDLPRMIDAATERIEGKLGGLNLPRQIQDLSERLDDLRPALKSAGTAMAIYETARDARKNPRTIVLATSNVISEIFSKYVPQLAESLHDHTKDPSLEIQVRDHSPIHDLMYQLASSLKTGGVWFGITLLEHSSAWRMQEGDSFSKFRDLTRKRAREKELCVLRLYHFETKTSFELLEKEMREEMQNGIEVRWCIGGEKPPDISLLWAPKRDGATQFSMPPEMKDVVSAVRTHYFDRICALEYDTRAGALLTNVILYSEKSPEYDRVDNLFQRHWKRATPLEG
jgi:hypothetical protein